MKDLSGTPATWPFQGNFVGGAGAGRGTHKSVLDALTDKSSNEPVEEASNEGSEPSGEGSE